MPIADILYGDCFEHMCCVIEIQLYIGKGLVLRMNLLQNRLDKLFSTLRQKITALSSPKSKKPIEDWDFIMVFEDRYEQEIQAYFTHFSHPKSKPIFQIRILPYKSEEKLLVLIQIADDELARQASDLKILKKKKKKSYDFDLKTINRLIYNAEDQKNTNYCNYLKWIRARMLPENADIYEQEKYSVFNVHKRNNYELNSEGQLFSPEEELRAKYNFLLCHSEEVPHKSYKEDAFIYPFADIMKHAGFKQLIPIHKNSRFPHIIFGSVKEYVGANSQTYFDFVSFFQRWLVFPMIIGILTIFFNNAYEFTADDSPGDFIYALIMMIWGIMFITQWENNQKWHNACEQTGYSDQWSEHQNQVDKSICHVRESPVSGQKHRYYPFYKKVQFYLISISVCLLILAISLVWMVISLNARGFIEAEHKFLYFESISGWASQGGIFDSKTSWGQIPNLIHVIVTNGFDEVVYRPLAKKMTRYERHLNPKAHENSIILKYFIYEFIITFADLFYIAFVRFDIVGLREQLVSLFFIDIIRRFVAELIIPKLKNKYLSYSVKGKLTDKVTKTYDQLQSDAILEVEKEDYQPFDDYLEIVTNFGYLVMLSSCFPIAPLLIIIAHGIEGLQDKYKIVHIFRRKLPTKYVGMGMWQTIVVFICYFSIITNILLFAFSSHQIVSLFPSFFESGKDLLYGNSNIGDFFSDTAESVTAILTSAMNSSAIFTSAMNSTMVESVSTLASEVIENLPYMDMSSSNIEYGPPLVTSFIPPAEEHEVQFITVLFIIEHFFLISFICLRNILSRQESSVDILLKRREIKRKIKKHLQKDLLAQEFRDKMVEMLFKGEDSQASSMTKSAVKTTGGIFDILVGAFEKEEKADGQLTEEQTNSQEQQLSRDICQKQLKKD